MFSRRGSRRTVLGSAGQRSNLAPAQKGRQTESSHLNRILVLVAALVAATAMSPAAAEAQDSRPNILIIVTDDQRASNTLGVMPKTLRYFRLGGR
ncbi:MAG: hypothetical protein ACRDNR_06215 [Gaiellaceae bacterium]